MTRFTQRMHFIALTDSSTKASRWQWRQGGALPMTFVIMIVTSVMTLQTMQSIAIQRRSLLARFELQQSLEWIELGKMRVREQIQVVSDYRGEEIPVPDWNVGVNQPATSADAPRVVLSRINHDGGSKSEAADEWGINIVSGMAAKAIILASWQGTL